MESELWGLVWKVTNLVILVVLLYKLLVGRVKTFFENRRLAVDKEIQEADMSKKEVERRHGELKEKLENIEKEIEELTELFRNEGLAEKERIIETARKEAEKIKEQGVRAVEQEAIKVRSMIRKEFAESVVKAAEDLVKKRLTGKDQERIVKEYIEKVVQLN
jgi:F-type H+-transporting ATPase subunit b